MYLLHALILISNMLFGCVQKFPTVQALAAATEDEVNAMWAGLGYYRRARFLLAGAQYVVGELGGQFPTCAAELRKIPGTSAGPCTCCKQSYCCLLCALLLLTLASRPGLQLSRILRRRPLT